jgi:hypothetical protein
VNKQTIANQIERARVILTVAASNAQVQERLALVSYDAETIKVGQSLYDACMSARRAAHAARGDCIQATAATRALRRRVEEQYATLAQIMRAAFAENSEMLVGLGLRTNRRPAAGTSVPLEPEPGNDPLAGKRARRASGAQARFFDRARQLYDGVLASKTLLAELAQLNYPLERLQRERDDLRALELADVVQGQQQAAAKASTAVQRESLAALQRWVARFSGIVKPALKDRPDLLNSMGLRVRGR